MTQHYVKYLAYSHPNRITYALHPIAIIVVSPNVQYVRNKPFLGFIPRHEQSGSSIVVLEAIQVTYVIYNIVIVLSNLIAIANEVVGHLDVVQKWSLAHLKNFARPKMQI